MKKLVKRILIFIVPALLILVLLPVNKRLRYQGLKDDCFDHGLWIHDRVFENEKAIDIAFLGSSHTINGIDDQLITAQLNGYNAVNIGYCRLGRNLNYVLFKEVLSSKSLKKIVIEVREDENRYSHPIFPYLASSADAMMAEPFFNKDILADAWTHLKYKIEITQDMLYEHETTAAIRTADFGFASHSDTASVDFLDEINKKRSILKKEKSNINKYFYNKLPKTYLNKIIQTCKAHEIEIYFLFLPSYGKEVERPLAHVYYQENGKLLSPPQHIFRNTDHWYDENHLNEAGARELSLWVAQQISE